MSKITEQRGQAVRAIHAWVTEHVLPFVPAGADWRTDQADELITRIRGLHGMSRAERWDAAVEQWAALVEEERDGGGHIQWAYFQGTVWFGYATEGLV